MAKIGIYYGSSTGNTKDVANLIAKKLGVQPTDVHDVAKAKADFADYDVLLFGTSTWGSGDLQDDWESFINKVKAADLTGKTVALFGCGDSSANSDTFCGGMSHIYNVLKDKSCKIIGQVSTEGYSFDDSESVVDGKFVGLPNDIDNEGDLVEERVSAWVEQLETDI